MSQLLKSENVVKFLDNFLNGMLLGITSLLAAINDPSLLRSYKSHVKMCLFVTLPTYFLLWILCTVARLLLLLLQPFFYADLQETVPSAVSLLIWLSFAIPPLIFTIMRYFAYAFYEIAFFRELHRLNPVVCAQLRPISALSSWLTFWFSIKRFGRLSMMGFALFLAGYIPIIGFFVRPAFGIYLSIKLTGCTEVGLALGLGGMLPGIGKQIKVLQHWLITLRSLSREVLDPYLSRVDCELHHRSKTSGHKLKSCQISVEGTMPLTLSQLSRKDLPFVMGFSVPSLMLMTIPFVGPAFFLVSQAASSHLALHVLVDNSKSKATQKNLQ